MLLEARNLKKYFKNNHVKAVDDVSLSIDRGQTLGIVGESGSGKSTLAKLILKLLSLDDGEIFFEGQDISHAKERQLRDFRRKVQIIFQDPFHSLDPRLRVEDILKEPFFLGGRRHRKNLSQNVSELMKAVELPECLRFRFPHQLSGGECQRVAIARAVSLNPELIVCDEAVSSLDALVRAQILNLLLKLQKEKSMAYVFISHDLKVVRHMSDQVLIVKDGQVCETGSSDEVFLNPKSAYTRALIGHLYGL